ncbi:MAG: spermidine synthase [Candidatus Binatia bacterium]
MFIIEPLVAKMILPFLGGSPAVWNASLAFYQAALLIGYAYAHYLGAWIGIKGQAVLHLALVAAAILLLPVTLPMQWLSTPAEHPTQLVLGALTMSIGFPLFVIAAGTPMLQQWFAQSRHSASRDPYFLYAASNAGSLAGLLAYPALIEPNLTLNQQNYYWFHGYLGLALLIALCLLSFLYSSTTRAVADPEPRAAAAGVGADGFHDDQLPIALSRRLRWLLWSFVPSSLLSGVTLYITTDVVSAPLFWVIPLAAYLLSFIVAFGGAQWATGPFLVRRQAFLLLAAAIIVAVSATSPVYIVLPLHLLAFFVTAVICHGRLAQDRPPARQLTGFYLWISLGGVLGGLFNALLAPQVFSSVLEYPLMMVAAAFARPVFSGAENLAAGKKADWLLPVLLCATMMLLLELGKAMPSLSRANLHLMIFGISGMLCLTFADRPVRFGLGLIALFLIAARFPPSYGHEIFHGRSFFGAYRVTHDLATNRQLLFHGTTIHGAQNSEAAKHLIPLSYYHRSGPAGQVLLAGARSGAASKVAIVGLGTGALACHGAAAQQFTFYEIDPMVEKIARDPRLFTYLRDCPPKVDVIIGDARLSLASAPSDYFDIFVLDAFSSDVIPTHLLTRQAFELYLRKLSGGGILLIHISNRHMDLAPVLDRLAKELELTALIQDDFELTPAEIAEGKSPSRWMLLSRDRRAADTFASGARWQRLDGRLGGDLWTDEFSNVVKVLRWR